MNEIAIEKDIVLISNQTLIKLFSYKNGGDLVALYMFYHKQCKLQGTNQSFSVGDFVKKGLGWGDKRFKEAKKILKELNLIEDIPHRDDKGKIVGWYIKLNYIKSHNEAILSSGAENHPVDKTTHWIEPPTGLEETNAGNIKNKMLKDIKNKMLKVNKINNNFSKEKEQSSEKINLEIINKEKIKEIKKENKKERDKDIDEIIEALEKCNLGILDDTIKEQRRYGKLIKNKINKIKGFDGRYGDFIKYVYENSDEYRKNYFRSAKKFYYNLANIIAGIKIQKEKKNNIIVC